ncbi:hypothetical protein BJ165DRAFT_1502277, partial [Panaeolus papilionaceus]
LLGSIPRSAFILSQVCHHWRAIATSHPLLWRSVYVSLKTKSPSSLLTVWLPRTGRAELFISITADRVSWDGPELEELQACLRLLYDASTRWKSLSFVLNDVARRELIRAASVSREIGDTPDLSSLEQIESRMVYAKYSADRDEYEFIDRFCDALRIAPPILRIGGWGTSDLRIPSPKLVKVNPKLQSVVSMTIFRQCLGWLYSLLRSLALMPHLRLLEFRDCESPYYLRSDYAKRVTLPHLEKLSIMDMRHHHDVESILNSVILPSLIDVTFTPPLHTPSFYEMATLSNCKIRHLDMKANKYFFDYLFQFLAAPFFTTLEDLTLDAELHTHQVDFLSGEPETSYFGHSKSGKEIEIPVFKESLKSLTLLGCSCNDGVLGQVARSRMRNGKLRYFYAEVVGKVSTKHPKDDEMIGDLRRCGLEAHLRQRFSS